MRWTTRGDGDLRPPGAGAHTALERAAGQPVAWATQAHGTAVVIADRPGHAGTGDALVTTRQGLGLAVFSADCAPVALSGGDGVAPDHVVAVVHAGWRGLLAGVVDAAVEALRSRGAIRVVAGLGPCIHPECYAFGGALLDGMVHRFGAGVASVSADGRSALDLPAVVRVALDRAGAQLVEESRTCTACAATSLFSHRGRGDAGRQATIVWRAGG